MSARAPRIAVLGSEKSWHVCELRRAASKMGVDLTVIGFDLLSAAIPDAANILGDFDATIVRSMPKGKLEQIIFRMDVLGEYFRSGGVVINPPRALEICIDKYLALSRLASNGIEVPHTFVCQSLEQATSAAEALGGDVVLKPLFGSEGKGIVRSSDPTTLRSHCEYQLETEGVVYIQEFIAECDSDLRLLVLVDEVFGMIRRNPKDWRQNVKQGALVEAIDVSDELATLAREAVRAVGALFGGVDVMHAPWRNPVVLEVNAVPGWKALNGTTSVDLSARFIAQALKVSGIL